MSPYCQRAYSIRTRIKTVLPLLLPSPRIPVREHIPLEQGLRLLIEDVHGRIVYVREHIPLEQGLRLLREER